jgi:H+/gluconate symporter-like permease
MRFEAQRRSAAMLARGRPARCGTPPLCRALEELHCVASIAPGGMDTLPHNGAVITLIAVTGLTHRVSYGGIFAITCIKTSAVFVAIAFYYLTGIY